MGAASPKSLHSPGNGRIAFGTALRLGITGKSRYRGKKFLSFLRLREVSKRFLAQSEFWQFCMHETLPPWFAVDYIRGSSSIEYYRYLPGTWGKARFPFERG